MKIKRKYISQIISKVTEWLELRYIAKNIPLDKTTTLDPIMYNTL